MPALSLWSNLGRKRQQWQALRGWERKVLIQFAVLLPLTWLGLRTIGFNRLHCLCLPVPAPTRLPEDGLSLHPHKWRRLRVGFLSIPTSGGDREGEVAAGEASSPLELAQRYAVLAAIAARHGIYQANCLHQSLPLCWLLQRKGLPAQLKIGVKPQTRPFQAHAWVELDGVPLGQTVTEYSAFNTLNVESDPSS
jgi:hypothetical protein